mmetsp:Transcript_16419/g.19176  ORF Transcript_16419/g.19176 Transcript_16419/m.19176 type:complete len:389 (-) Transcript_16419:340-1506(-)|eukprot:CAMPEP_0184058916 /NCGR_PEP_ID=MMETSP0956-20121227/9631_1 /TAXON_ID=627963 /ORGANISM="Aplanochytrium sp, Strain PBS07" /LENGTH=388 /DNA_ID=CAMNT_0026354171 /DNA_START=126 /DNA_END=1292 /DNA_ORIENTATION=-
MTNNDRSVWSTDAILSETLKSGLLVWVPLYCVTGVIQPILVDYVRYNGGTNDWPPTLLPLLANALGMALVLKLANITNVKLSYNQNNGRSLVRKRRNSGEWIFRYLSRTEKRRFIIATMLDFGSAACTITGLLLVGSGIYTIIYSSGTAWTAVISWIYGKELHQGQWMGVFIVTLGLALNSYGIVDDFGDFSQRLLLGSLVLFLGTVLHSASFVYNEAQILPKRNDAVTQISPFLLCAIMGQLETICLIFWNTVLIGLYGFTSLYTVTSSVLCCYMILVLSNAVHALAFFAMLGQLGAVSTGILKGILSVLVMGFSSLFFCQFEKSQCLTPIKALSLIVTLFGSLTFIMATADTKTGRSVGSKASCNNYRQIQSVKTPGHLSREHTKV